MAAVVDDADVSDDALVREFDAVEIWTFGTT